MIVAEALTIKESAEKVAPMIDAYVPGESSLTDYTSIKNIVGGLYPTPQVMPPEQEFMAGSLGRVEESLRNEGIDYHRLVSFEDRVAEEIHSRLVSFMQEVRAHSVITDESIKSQFDFLLNKYCNDISSKPVKELEQFQFPDPKTVTKKLEKEAAMFMVNAKDVLKARLLAINEDYKAYLAKGDSATYEEFLAISELIERVVFKENAYPHSVIMFVRQELASEGVEIAECIHPKGWYIRPVAKVEKEVESKVSSFKDSYQNTINSGHVDRTNIFAVARYRQLLKGRDKYIDLLKPRTLADIARARMADPGDIIAREAEAIDSKQL